MDSRRKAVQYYKLGCKAPQGSYMSQSLFAKSISCDPAFSYSYFEKSVPFNKRGDYSKGFELLNKAVDLNPEMHLGYRGWLKLVKLKDFKGCISDLEALLKLKPNKKMAWGQNINSLLAISYYSIGEPKTALLKINALLGESQNSPIFCLYRAIICLELMCLSMALKDLRRSIQLDKNFTEAYFYLGKANEMTGNHEEARENIKNARRLFLQGYKLKNPYNEVFGELYLSEIE